MEAGFDVLEIIDESSGSILIFTDAEIFEEYNTAQARGLDFDYTRVEERAWDGAYAIA